MTLLREQAIEIIETVLATQYGAHSISFRDVMVKNNQVSVTVIGASKEQHPAIEVALLDMLQTSGATAVYCRFRDGAAPAGSPPEKTIEAGNEARQPIQGHAAIWRVHC